MKNAAHFKHASETGGYLERFNNKIDIHTPKLDVGNGECSPVWIEEDPPMPAGVEPAELARFHRQNPMGRGCWSDADAVWL